MTHVIHQYLRRLRAPGAGFSRNRYFELLSTPEGLRAMRLNKFLKSLEKDVSDYARDPQEQAIKISLLNGGLIRMELLCENIKGRRISFLSPAEFEILLESPAAGPIVSRLWKEI